MSALVRLYPAAWRARYGPEFEALLVERPPSLRDTLDITVSALDARLLPQLPSGAEPRGVGRGARLAGGAAIAGGLVWCATYLAAMLDTTGSNWTLPILIALVLMLLSLPGRYLSAYVRPVAIGVAAVGLSLTAWVSEILPWGIVLLVPILAVAIVLGPGMLALAAARAGMAPRERWRLVLVTMPWPVLAAIAVGSGLLAEPLSMPLLVVSTLPMGIAWIVVGARVARGRILDASHEPPIHPDSTIATAGGTA